MKVVLLSAAPKISSQPIVEVLHELVPRSVAFHLVTWAPPTAELLAVQPDTVILGPVKVRAQPEAHAITGSQDATDSSTARESEVAERPVAPVAARIPLSRSRLLAPARRLRSAAHPHRAWRRLTKTPAALAWLGDADVIIAMDAPAILSAWRLAKKNPNADVVYGLSAGRGLITRALEG